MPRIRKIQDPPLWRLGSTAHYRDAQLYDLTYRRRRADVRFYVEQAKTYGGPNKPILELGVGSGRVALAIVGERIPVVGVDLVPQMLERAAMQLQTLPATKQKLLTLKPGDMRTIRLRQRFDLIIAPFHVFMHLYSRADIEAALSTCHLHLRPRGKLIFDVRMPQLGELVRDPHRVYRGGIVHLAPTKCPHRYTEQFAYDPLSQVQIVNMDWTPLDDSLAVARTITLTHRQFFPAELEALLHYNGFVIEKIFGNFDGSPLTADSEEQIVIARAR